MKISSYKGLLSSLAEWRSWDDDEVYDFGGIIAVLGACLRNLDQYGVEGELNEVANYLEPEEVRMLLRLAELARANPAEDQEGR